MPEPHLRSLLRRGAQIRGRATLLEMQPSRCHTNSLILHLMSPKHIRVATGYALTKSDGLWRQHSWAIDGNKIVETTISRLSYWGIELTDDEIRHFIVQSLASI